jgi:hypothetical protein
MHSGDFVIPAHHAHLEKNMAVFLSVLSAHCNENVFQLSAK